jgi:KUP system potassium uptake protein
MCVIFVTLITTSMVFLVAIIVWRIPSIIAVFFFIVYFCLEGVYMTSTLRKIPQGAWFTLFLAVILSSIFILWRWGKEQQWSAEGQDRIRPEELLMVSRATGGGTAVNGKAAAPKLVLTDVFGGGEVSTASGLGIFFDKTGGGDNIVPRVFTQFLRKFKARPDVIVFFHMRPLSLPTIPVEERFVITRANPALVSSYRVTLRHGYTDSVLSPDLGNIIVEQLSDFIHGKLTACAAEDLPPAVREELRALELAKAAQVVYVLGKQVMRARREEGNVVRRSLRALLLGVFLWIRENSRAKLADLDIDYNKLVEVGFVKEV